MRDPYSYLLVFLLVISSMLAGAAQTASAAGDRVEIVDQTRLPLHEEYVTCRGYEDVAKAIMELSNY